MSVFENTMQEATTIDQVIEQLGEIVTWAEENNSPMGYFPALYKRVTELVKEKIDDGNGTYFEDNARMERLDVIFANRYLKAFHQYHHQQKGELSQSWEVAFDACNHYWPIVLQRGL